MFHLANFAKNIKAARLGAKLTQDELAEKISVTRQAVSNWENGKTEPDIDTLTKLAEVTNVTVEELIYGINPKDEERDVKTYKRLAIIFGVLAISLFLLILVFTPAINEYYKYYYITWPAFIGLFVCKPAAYIFAAISIMSLIAYKNDIRIKNKKVKLAFLIAGIISFILLTFYELSASFFPIRALINYYMFLFKNPLLYAVPTVLLYLGLIKK